MVLATVIEDDWLLRFLVSREFAFQLDSVVG